MVSLEKIKEELGIVKEYYLYEEKIAKISKRAGKNDSEILAEKYSKAICKAPAKLYVVYGCLYIEGMSYDATAIDLGYCKDHIWKLSRELLNYLQKYFSQER